MNDQELRAVVRDAVRRRLAAHGDGLDTPVSGASTERSPIAAAASHHHPSHDVYITLVNVGDACLIEPSVMCNHCNYCRSHGH